MTDPIADMLSHIRNALLVRKETVTLGHSKVKEAIAVIFKKYGFIADYQVKGDNIKLLEMILFSEDAPSKVTALQRVSKPGRRVYVSRDDIPVVMSGRGLVVMSTSRGIMAGHEAYSQNIGGELICKVW